MANERLGLVEVRQADRAKFARFAYRAPAVTPEAIRLPQILRSKYHRIWDEAMPDRARDVIVVTCGVFGVTPELMMERTRRTAPTRARLAAYGLMRSMLRFSMPTLGRIFRRDQSTVSDGIARVQKLRETDMSFAHRYSHAMSLVRQKWAA